MSIEAMKQALEDFKRIRHHFDTDEYAWEISDHAITSLRQAIEQAEKQEPVAIVSGYYGGQCVVLPTNPARLFNSGTAFYTTPQPQREWVGLTDEEIQFIYADSGYNDIEMFASAIEAKLRSKNT